ncbi:MAG: hypothetical protein JNK76_03520 [Planctomycetales bacterium]|nr:hypothetical protein [Planctomycetales bacterium]
MSGDGTITVSWESKMGELLRATAEENKELAKIVDNLKKQNKEAQETGNIHTRMQAVAKRAWDETRTGAEKSAMKVAELNAAYKRGYLDVETYNRAVAKLNEGQQSGLSKLIGTAKEAAASVTGVGSALAAVSALAGVVKSEYDRFLQRHKSAADYGATEAELKSTLMLNAPIDMSGQEMDAIVSGVAQAANVENLKVMQAMAPAVSVSPNASMQQVAGFVGAGAMLTGGNQGAMTGLARAGLGLADSLGMLNDPQKTLGFLNAAQMQSMVADPEAYAKSSATAFAASNVGKLDLRQTAAMFGMFTRGAQDMSGDSSGTATIQFQNQLAAQRETLGLGADASQNDILAALDADPRAKEKFLKGMTGEAKYLGLMRSVVQGGEKRQAYLDALQGIPELQNGDQFFNMRLLQRGADPTAYNQAVTRVFDRTAESYDANKDTQLGGKVMEGVDKVLARLPGGSPMDWLDRKSASLNTWARIAMGQNPNEAGAVQLEQLADDYEMKGPGYSLSRAVMSPSKDDLQAASDLREAAKQLRAAADEQKRSTEEFKKAVDAMKTRPGGTNGPRPPKPGETP